MKFGAKLPKININIYKFYYINNNIIYFLFCE